MFFDIQNATVANNESVPRYTFKRNTDNTGFATTDGAPLRQNGSNGIPLILKDAAGNLTPTIGIVFEF